MTGGVVKFAGGVTVGISGSKVTLTSVSPSIVNWQRPPPEQGPSDQRGNAEPDCGKPLSVNAVPSSKLCEQVVEQVMPPGRIVTVPLPVPTTWTVRVSSRGGAEAT